MSEQNQPDQSRRQLLKNLGLSAAAGAVAAGTTKAVAATDPAEARDVQPKNDTSYRETQHVRDYYDTL